MFVVVVVVVIVISICTGENIFEVVIYMSIKRKKNQISIMSIKGFLFLFVVACQILKNFVFVPVIRIQVETERKQKKRIEIRSESFNDQSKV